MKRLPLLTLLFAVLFAFFFLLLILFRTPFPPYPLISWQDALDHLTPLALIPLYWLMFRSSGRETTRGEELAFILISVVWILGHGMHLAANSVDNLIEGLAKKGAIDITGTEIYTLVYFFDETLSHYLWHIGIFGLAALLVYHEWRRPAGIPTAWGLAILAGIIHGFSFFSVVLEGQTVPLGLPFAALITLVVLIWGLKKLGRQPVLAFFFIAFLVAVLFFAGWGLYWGGFPEFSEVGLI